MRLPSHTSTSFSFSSGVILNLAADQLRSVLDRASVASDMLTSSPRQNVSHAACNGMQESCIGNSFRGCLLLLGQNCVYISILSQIYTARVISL